VRELNEPRNRRILVIDDNEAIHDDFRKILAADVNPGALIESRAAFFGVESSAADDSPTFEIDVAFQGQEALEKVRKSLRDNRPYAMAYVDVRMPPGWDGIETTQHIWSEDPNLLVVICTAYSDYSWHEMVERLRNADRWLLLKKPFDNIEVRQLACSLTEKWHLARQAELKLADLVRLVEERTRDIERARQQLFESKKLEAVGTLAGGVAHEFNNLLQVIRGYTSFAMQGLPPTERRFQDLRLVLDASEKAATLTSHLLSFSRRRPILPKDVNLNEVISRLVPMLSPIVGEQVQIKTDLDDELALVHADVTTIEQALLNLCTNARDSMPAGGTLTIKTEQLHLSEADCRLRAGAKPGNYTRLSITDTGTGMTPDVKQRAFEPFFTTKEVGKGTGLGLSMVYGAMQQHEGMIEVESEIGQGTTVELYLPSLAKPLKRCVVKSPDAVLGGTETILIAEDEANVRELTARLLKGAGYSVLVAADGDEAIRLFEKKQDVVSLLVLDMVMPKVNGRKAYEHIKTLNRGVKAVFCTGYEPHKSGTEFISEQGLHLIQKPFDPSVLLQTLRQVLDADESCHERPTIDRNIKK
jgi:signal transduction histidine kinase